jgi:replicative DNA helicase
MQPQHSRNAPFVNTVSTPPSNVDVEQALLGAILADNTALDKVSDFLKPLHFFYPLNGDIFETATDLIRQGRTASPITLRTFFEQAPLVEVEFGNPIPASQYLVRLSTMPAIPSSVRDYGQTIFELATRRQIILAAEDMLAAAYDLKPNAPVGKITDEGMARLHHISDSITPQKKQRSFRDLVEEALQQANDAYCNGGRLSGLACGISDLDAKIGGLKVVYPLSVVMMCFGDAP